jgi:hypothetical protein
MSLRIIVMTALAMFTALAQGEGDPASQLRTSRSLKCHFGPGTVTLWTGNNPVVSPAPHNEDVRFDSIDLKIRTARVTRNSGAAEISALPTAVGMSLIESNPTTVTTTTVFASFGADSEFLAVDSRQVLFVATATVEQYYGNCKTLQ